MKKIISSYSLMTALAFVLLSSCDKRLEVAPTQSIDENAALATNNDVRVTLIGCYDGLQSTTLYGGAIQVGSELLGDNGEVRFFGTFQELTEMYDKTMTTINGNASTTWSNAYNTINRCNNVLSALDKVDAGLKARYEGEARFIRGSLYFELVRLYAKTWGDGDNASNLGVPIVLTPTRGVTDADYRPRSSVAQVYAQVIDDLTKAEALLPAANGIYASKNAAAAQLSRVYLMQADYANARDAANRVITSGRQRLNGTFGASFNTFLNNGGANTPEHIFAIQVTQQDGISYLNNHFGTTLGSVPGTAGRSDIRVQARHLAEYAAGDARRAFFVQTGQGVFTSKHLDRFGNVGIFRFAEMLLTRAEANFRLGTSTGATALADINAVRARAGLAPMTVLTIADILKERKLELAFEGHLLHDLKRTRRGTGSLNFNSEKLIFPIPQREMDVNKQLVQNAGY